MANLTASRLRRVTLASRCVLQRQRKGRQKWEAGCLSASGVCRSPAAKPGNTSKEPLQSVIAHQMQLPNDLQPGCFIMQSAGEDEDNSFAARSKKQEARRKKSHERPLDACFFRNLPSLSSRGKCHPPLLQLSAHGPSLQHRQREKPVPASLGCNAVIADPTPHLLLVFIAVVIQDEHVVNCAGAAIVVRGQLSDVRTCRHDQQYTPSGLPHQPGRREMITALAG